jgi:AcrB/AcrD/AcrF family
MLIYLDSALTELQARRSAEGRPLTSDDLGAAIMSGAVERVRPKMMTVCAIMAGLLPIMWSHGTGAEVMQRIAVPMIGRNGVVDLADADRYSGDLCGGQRRCDSIAAPGAIPAANVSCGSGAANLVLLA